MKKYIIILSGIPFFMVLFCCQSSLKAYQADSTTISISLSTVTERSETPLNIPVSMSVILSWEGKPDRYLIGSFEDPVLTNLEVVGSKSTSRTELRDGNVFTVKEYTFSLLPIQPGMGYIEGMIIGYTDKLTDTKDYLITQRMSIKGLPPVYEKDYSLILTVIGLLTLIALLIGFLFVIRRRKIERTLGKIQPVIIEDVIFERLKAVRTRLNLSFRQKLDEVIAEFRNFLVKKFDIPEDRKSDTSIIETLRETAVDAEIIAKVQKIFEHAEELRFSGREVKNDDFELIYGEIESCVEVCIQTDKKEALSDN